MVTLTIDNETYQALRQKAALRGQSVEEWLKSEGEAAIDRQPMANVPPDSWEEQLMAFAQRHQATGHPLDCSRESIHD